MKVRVKNSGTNLNGFYQVLNGKNEICACDCLKKANLIKKLINREITLDLNRELYILTEDYKCLNNE